MRILRHQDRHDRGRTHCDVLGRAHQAVNEAAHEGAVEPVLQDT